MRDIIAIMKVASKSPENDIAATKRDSQSSPEIAFDIGMVHASSGGTVTVAHGAKGLPLRGDCSKLRLSIRFIYVFRQGSQIRNPVEREHVRCSWSTDPFELVPIATHVQELAPQHEWA